MATAISINRTGVGLDEVIEAVRAELGSRYTIERGSKPDAFTVKGGLMTTASVQLQQDGARTNAVVKGGGLLITQRIRNNRGIAQEVAGAIERSPLLRGPGR
jgi:hypothetical protein